MAKTKKTKSKKKLSKPTLTSPQQGIEMAHKIWLAGVGAYGKAYDVASERAEKVSDVSNEVFEDLVKRGEKIEAGMKSRVVSNKAFSKISAQLVTAGKQISKMQSGMMGQAETVTETVAKIQADQRERLEARMERMRQALGLTAFSGKSKKAEKLHAKLDTLEEQVASLQSDAEGVDDKVKARVERLSKEIGKLAGAAPKKSKKTKKSTKPATAAKTAKPEAAKTAAPRPEKAKVASPKTDARGRLTGPMGAADDLKLIKGVGVVLEKRLNDAGIFHFWQIAALKPNQVTELEADMRFPGRITRDAWTKQAAEFEKLK